MIFVCVCTPRVKPYKLRIPQHFSLSLKEKVLANLSYNDAKLTQKVNALVGSPFNLKERWRLKGIGSSKLLITESSVDIYNLLILDQNTNSCSIELRPKGIIIRFRSLLETYGLIIPYYKLKLYKGKSEEYSLYMDQHRIKVAATNKSTHAFFKKVSREKINNLPQSPNDLL